jgi:hypothetical protein
MTYPTAAAAPDAASVNPNGSGLCVSGVGDVVVVVPVVPVVPVPPLGGT